MQRAGGRLENAHSGCMSWEGPGGRLRGRSGESVLAHGALCFPSSQPATLLVGRGSSWKDYLGLLWVV